MTFLLLFMPRALVFAEFLVFLAQIALRVSPNFAEFRCLRSNVMDGIILYERKDCNRQKIVCGLFRHYGNLGGFAIF